jgi:hypothetical protein
VTACAEVLHELGVAQRRGGGRPASSTQDASLAGRGSPRGSPSCLSGGTRVISGRLGGGERADDDVRCGGDGATGDAVRMDKMRIMGLPWR